MVHRFTPFEPCPGSDNPPHTSKRNLRKTLTIVKFVSITFLDQRLYFVCGMNDRIYFISLDIISLNTNKSFRTTFGLVNTFHEDIK